eukprot:5953750-Lingulodinium_polyedra.AAC.1
MAGHNRRTVIYGRAFADSSRQTTRPTAGRARVANNARGRVNQRARNARWPRPLTGRSYPCGRKRRLTTI